MTDENADGLAAIRAHFTVEAAPRQRDKWLISCEHCGAQWHLNKGKPHVGNVLHLLNHARGHKSRARRP